MINILMKTKLLWKSFTNPSQIQKRAEEIAETAQVIEQLANIKNVIRDSDLSQDSVDKGMDSSVPVSEVLKTLTSDVSLF